MSIKDWPKTERPREKLLQNGPQSLSDAELLALFLRCGRSGQSAVDLGRHVLQELGGLTGVLAASRELFTSVPGLGSARYAELQAAIELGRRQLGEDVQRLGVLSNPTATRQYLTTWLRHRQQEVFACLFLDSQHRIIAGKEMFFGTIDNASVHPREIVRLALQHNAAAVVLAHNHPSGVAEPSTADRQITRIIQQALSLIDVRVLDHVVIGGKDATSLAEKGWL